MTPTIPLKENTLKSLKDFMRNMDAYNVKFRVSYDDAVKILLYMFKNIRVTYALTPDEMKEYIKRALDIDISQKQLTEYPPSEKQPI